MGLLVKSVLGMITAFLVSFYLLNHPPDPLPLTYDTALVDGYSMTTFGSKTAYRHHGLRPMRPSLRPPLRLVSVNGLFRHGTRAPEAAFSAEVAHLRERLLSVLPQWNFSLGSSINESKVLLPAGSRELADLGGRLRRMVPDHFRRSASTRVFASPTQRTTGSAQAFVRSYFDDPEDVSVESDAARLRFFDNCEHYRDGVRKNKTARKEYSDFANGPEMKAVLDEVNARNGLGRLNLTIKDITDIYKMAGHEVAALDTVTSASLPGWVRVFRPEHLYTLEYHHDLKQYWTKANPYPVNYEQVCPLWGSIMQQLVDAATHDARRANDEALQVPHSVFWFAHAETLLPLVIKLGLFNESSRANCTTPCGQHLTASGLRASRLHRLNPLASLPDPNLYRSSHIIPFAGNIVFFLLHCPNKAVSSASPLHEYCVEVLLNEQVVDIIPQLSDEPRPLRLATILEYFRGCLPLHYDKAALCDIKKT